MSRQSKKRPTAKQKALAKQRQQWQREWSEAKREQAAVKAKKRESKAPMPGSPRLATQAEFRKIGGRTRIVSGGAIETNRQKH
jgi:hypothetical protein